MSKSTKQIWKYLLAATDRQQADIPRGAVALSAQVQRGIICVWMLVDIRAARVLHTFDIVGTGHNILSGREAGMGEFLDTVQLGSLVFHVFHKEESQK